MDPVTLGYYGAVCGLLGLASPWLGHFAVRFAVGIVVGLAAAALLPQVQAAMAY